MLRGEVVVSKEGMMRWGLMNDMRREGGSSWREGFAFRINLRLAVLCNSA